MRWKLFILGVLFCPGVCLMAKHEIDWQSVLPREIDGWGRQERVKVFHKDNLFDYIDGGAELYLSYGFRSLIACQYRRQGRTDITVDIFHMANSYNAFGVFSHSRETLEKDVGRDSEYAGGLLTFWKGHYYVSILSYPESDDSRKIIMEVGKLIASTIKEDGAYPPILAHLPSGGLVPESVRYFRHYVWINSHYFISTENILRFGKDTEAVLAKYRQGESSYFVLMVQYGGRQESRRAFAHFMAQYLPDADAGGMKKLEDNKWTGAGQIGRYVAAVFNAADRSTVAAVLKSIHDKVSGG